MQLIDSLLEADRTVLVDSSKDSKKELLDTFASAITKQFRELGFRTTTYYVPNKDIALLKIPGIGEVTVHNRGYYVENKGIYAVSIQSREPWTSVDVDIRYTGTIVNPNSIVWWLKTQFPEVWKTAQAKKSIELSGKSAVNSLISRGQGE
ncbi:MAG: hypothetical protein ACYSUV_02125 [Planctomycetota bacterium]